MRAGFPKAVPGMRVGLLGGSFDPAHDGHAHITREALKRFELDRVWWLVSPGNPLKSKGPAPMAKRIAAAQKVMDHPRVEISGIETKLGTQYTAETLQALFQVYPGVGFVWLMGADNLAGFHRWDRWEWIMENIPIGVLARPGERISARLSPAASRYRRFKIPARAASVLASSPTPSWCFVNVPMMDVSSSDIRARGEWTAEKS